MHEHEHDEMKTPSYKDQVNAAVAIAQGLSDPAETLLRNPPCGSRAFGGLAIIGLFAPLLISLGGAVYDGYLALGTVGLYCLGLSYQTAQRRKLEKAGVRIHSKQLGAPKFKGQPPVVFLLGLLCAGLGPAFGASSAFGIYWCVVGVSLGIARGYTQASWTARKQAMQDAEIEQEHMWNMRGR